MKRTILRTIRVVLCFVFLWAFFDKLFGLGFATLRENAWIKGGSPTDGFLSFGTSGPFAAFFQSLAGNAVVEWVFMLGLLGIGLSLLTGIWLRWIGVLGAFLMILMYLASLPPENNPLVDEHIIYALLLLFFAAARQRIRLQPAIM